MLARSVGWVGFRWFRQVGIPPGNSAQLLAAAFIAADWLSL